MEIDKEAEDLHSQERLVNSLLHKELLDTAKTCHELASKLENPSVVSCYVGFDYGDVILDQNLKDVADEFRKLIKDVTKTFNKISSNVNSPRYNIKFIKDKLEALNIKVKANESPSQCDHLNSALNAHANFSESFLNTLAEKLAQYIDNRPQPQFKEDEEAVLLADEEINQAQQDSLLEVLREIKPSASPDDIKVLQTLKAIKTKAENLPSELYSAIQDYCYWILNDREKNSVP